MHPIATYFLSLKNAEEKQISLPYLIKERESLVTGCAEDVAVDNGHYCDTFMDSLEEGAESDVPEWEEAIGCPSKMIMYILFSCEMGFSHDKCVIPIKDTSDDEW